MQDPNSPIHVRFEVVLKLNPTDDKLALPSHHTADLRGGYHQQEDYGLTRVNDSSRFPTSTSFSTSPADTPSPRDQLRSSSASNGSATSWTSYSSQANPIDSRDHSPENVRAHHGAFTQVQYPQHWEVQNMNAAPAYGPHHHGYPDAHHMPPPPAPHHYPPPYHPQHHPYPTTMMPPPPQSSYGPHQYGPHHPPHHHHAAYGPHVASAQSMHPPQGYTSYPHPPPPQHMTLPAISAPPTSASDGAITLDYPHRVPDATGQIAPPGTGKPKVAATLWEDEGTLCFQVEANGICVTRRHDNHMINGTKLLNVAKMTRGRRDGLLKSEKQRRVMKIGPMHLKGVWIPYERALDFANKEKITELLYPLFLHDIDRLLGGQGGPGLSNCGKRSASKEASSARSSGSPPPRPSIPQRNSVADAPGPDSHEPAQTRPGLERAHTLPQASSSTSNLLGAGNSGGSFDYAGVTTVSSSHAQSLPATPNAPSPDHSNPNMQSHYGSIPAYDTRHATSGPTTQNAYEIPTAYYGQKGDMGPPPRSSRDIEGSTQGSYEHSGAYYTNHQAVESHVAPHTRSSPQTGSGSASDTHGQWPAYHHTQRNHTQPHSQAAYPSKTTNGYTTSGSSTQGYAYPSATGVSAKRARDEDDETVHVELDGNLKRQKTAEEAAAKYRTKSSSARR